MAATAIKGGLWIPDMPTLLGTPSFLAMTAMSASGHRTAVAVLQIPSTGTITNVGFRVNTVTTSDSVDVGIYTVDTSGNPTSTAYGGMVVGTQSPVAAGTFYTVPLGTSCSATAGDVVAVVLSFTSFVAGNFAASCAQGSSARNDFPYGAAYNGTTWTKGVTSTCPVVSLEYSGTAYNYAPGVYPWSAVANTTYNSGNSPNEYGMSFQLPVPATLAGVAFNISITAGALFDVDVYLSGTTVATNVSVTGNQAATTGSACMLYFQFATPQNLSANTLYRVTLRPTNTTSISLPIFTVPKAQALDQCGGGQNFCLCSRTGGAWDADSTTKRAAIYLNFSKFDDGAGGAAGMLYVPHLDGV